MIDRCEALPLPRFQGTTAVSRGPSMWGAKPRGDRVPGFPELLLQVFSNNGVFEVIILCPIDAKLLVVLDQFQDCLKPLSCSEIRFLVSTFPSIDRQELQGILRWQGLPKILLTLRREKATRKTGLSSCV